MSHVPCIMVIMVREKVVMELLEIIINTELIKQPRIAINKHELTGCDIFSSLSAEITKYSTKKAITRLKESMFLMKMPFLM